MAATSAVEQQPENWFDRFLQKYDDFCAYLYPYRAYIMEFFVGVFFPFPLVYVIKVLLFFCLFFFSGHFWFVLMFAVLDAKLRFGFVLFFKGLVVTVGFVASLNAPLGGLAVGSILMSLVYAGGHISGGV